MSVNLSHISFSRIQQVPFWKANSQEEKASLVERVCDECTSVEVYHVVTIFTYGWTGGARSRVKTLHPDKALAYVNRLYAGKWIDDATYHLMFCAVNNLLAKNSWPSHAGWELVPFDIQTSDGLFDVPKDVE